MPIRHEVYPQPKADVARATLRTWPYPDPQHNTPVVNPVEATERMYWRQTGTLAYGIGDPYPETDADLLIGETEHFANLRGGHDPSEPELDVQPRRRGRPPKPRDAEGRIIP